MLEVQGFSELKKAFFPPPISWLARQARVRLGEGVGKVRDRRKDSLRGLWSGREAEQFSVGLSLCSIGLPSSPSARAKKFVLSG